MRRFGFAGGGGSEKKRGVKRKKIKREQRTRNYFICLLSYKLSINKKCNISEFEF
jgi:hypothetical protein